MPDALSSRLAALGDPTRRAILEQVATRHVSVGELAAGLPVSRPAVSQHLRVLLDAGLVDVRQEGTRRLYRARPEAIGDLRAYFTSFWSQALAAFASAAEEESRDARSG